MADLNEYYTGLQRGRINPKDPFTHAAWLLTPDDQKQPQDDVVDKQVQLSYIGEDQMLRLYQNDAVLLTQIKNMALREPCLAPVYSVLEGSWRSECKLTRVLEGMERKLQGTAGGAYVPRETFEGGYGMQSAEERARQEEQQIDPSSILGMFKRRKR